MPTLAPTYLIPLLTAVMLITAGIRALGDQQTEFAGKVMILAPLLVVILGLSRSIHGTFHQLPTFTQRESSQAISVFLVILAAITLLALFQTRYKHRFSIVFWGTASLLVASTIILYSAV